MCLQQVFDKIFVSKFYQFCGYKYHSLDQYGHDQLTFEQLPYNMKYVMHQYLLNFYNIQKMIYNYDIWYIDLCLKKAGVKRQYFYESCGLPKTFNRTLNLQRNRDEKLILLRLGLIDLCNELFQYINQKK